MATLKQYFDTDLNRVLSARNTFQYGSADTDEEIEVVGRIHLDFDSNTWYISYYVPVFADMFHLGLSLIQDLTWATKMKESVSIDTGLPGEEPFHLSDLQFSGRIFIYSETEFSDDEMHILKKRGKGSNLAVRFRDPKFASERSKFEKPMAFVSHDSRDKDEVARPLALRLIQMLCPVWYDEYSLKVGDSLRQSIETGLKNCKKCILILSPNFLSNAGWTRKEFDSIFTREILENSNLVLPIWHNVSKSDVYEYCPSLADKFAIQWSFGVEEVSRQIYRAIIS